MSSAEGHDASGPPALVCVRCEDELTPTLDAVAGAMAREGFSADDVFGMRLALREALCNALRHAHGDDPAKQVRVRYHVTSACAVVEVEDEGPGFDPGGVADPRVPENRERPGGRGLLLMRAYLTWVRFNERGNAVTLCKVPSRG